MSNSDTVPRIVLVSSHPHDLPTDLKNRCLYHDPDTHDIPAVVAVSEHPADLPTDLKNRMLLHDTHKEELAHNIPAINNDFAAFGTQTPSHMLPADIRSRMVDHSHADDFAHGDMNSAKNGAGLRDNFSVNTAIPPITLVSTHPQAHDIPMGLKDRMLFPGQNAGHGNPDITKDCTACGGAGLPADLQARMIKPDFQHLGTIPEVTKTLNCPHGGDIPHDLKGRMLQVPGLHEIPAITLMDMGAKMPSDLSARMVNVTAGGPVANSAMFGANANNNNNLVKGAAGIGPGDVALSVQ